MPPQPDQPKRTSTSAPLLQGLLARVEMIDAPSRWCHMQPLPRSLGRTETCLLLILPMHENLIQ